MKACQSAWLVIWLSTCKYFRSLIFFAQFYFSLIFCAINIYNCSWFDLTSKKICGDWRQTLCKKWPMLDFFPRGESRYYWFGILHPSFPPISFYLPGRISHLYENPHSHQTGNIKLHYGDLTDSSCLVKIISEVQPRWPHQRMFVDIIMLIGGLSVVLVSCIGQYW